MRSGFLKFVIVLIALGSSASSFTYQEEATLVCVKKQSNSCHYNFVMGGVNYRYVDVGCKAKRDDILKKAQKGELGLAKDWKIVCPEVKKPE